MSSDAPEMRRAAGILVVDDTVENLDLLSAMLKANGHKARPVTGGVPALQAARNAPPDLILLDINMPDMDGYEVCRRLKADAALAGIPVIFISALGETEDKVEAFRCGGADYITKPFHVEEVMARVETHLRVRRLQLELETHNARLEETVRARTREITEARDRLAEANERLSILDRTKSDFLAIISHELRTPLNGLLGIADLILDEYRANPLAEALSADFQRSRERILTIVTDSLLLTQIEAKPGEAACAPLSLGVLLAAAREHCMDAAASRGLEIGRCPAQCGEVAGDAELLPKALEALLDTAVKFAKAGSIIRLSVTSGEDHVLLTVEAEGRVVPEDLLPKFFDVLAIAETIFPGGDLGLRPAVAERIISLNGGSVAVANLEPAGIRLSVRLRSGRRAREGA